MSNCNTCPKFHTISNVTYTAGTSLVLTVSNSTNIGNRSKFCLCVSKNISEVVTGDPVQVYATINGSNIPVYTKFGSDYPLYSDLLSKYYRCGRIMHGFYVNNGTTAYIQLTDVPYCDCANITGAN